MKIRLSEFHLFAAWEHHSELLQQALNLLDDCIGDRVPLDEAYAQIQQLEREADEILRNAVRELDFQKSDYPPRAEAWRLFCRLDRILDAVELLAGRLAAYRLGPLPTPARRLMEVIHSCAAPLRNCIQAFGQSEHFIGEFSSLVDLENEADQIYVRAVRELFETERDPVRLIKLNEAYGLLEGLVNLFEDCVQVIEDAALKTTA